MASPRGRVDFESALATKAKLFALVEEESEEYGEIPPREVPHLG